MRLAVTYIAQETNTFNPCPSTTAGFESFGLYRGSEMLDKLVGVGMVGGFLTAVEASGEAVEIVPLIKARDVAGGRLTDETLAQLTLELTERLADAGPLDGLAVLRHGACAAASEDDVEPDLVDTGRLAGELLVRVAAGLKAASNFQWFSHLSTWVIRADTSGPTQSDITALLWARVPRPVYPVDEVAHWH